MNKSIFLLAFMVALSAAAPSSDHDLEVAKDKTDRGLNGARNVTNDAIPDQGIAGMVDGILDSTNKMTQRILDSVKSRFGGDEEATASSGPNTHRAYPRPDPGVDNTPDLDVQDKSKLVKPHQPHAPHGHGNTTKPHRPHSNATAPDQ